MEPYGGGILAGNTAIQSALQSSHPGKLLPGELADRFLGISSSYWLMANSMIQALSGTSLQTAINTIWSMTNGSQYIQKWEFDTKQELVAKLPADTDPNLTLAVATFL